MVGVYLVHPFLALILVMLIYTNAYSGLSKKFRKGFKFRRDLHVKVGKSALVLFPITYTAGLLGIIDLGYPAYSTPHAYLDTLILLLFLLGGSLALLMLRGRWSLIKYHRAAMIGVVILLILQILGGIGNVIDFRIVEIKLA